MTSQSHMVGEAVKSSNYDEDGKPGDINVLEDILGGDDEVADEFDNELYKIETNDRKDKVEKNVRHLDDSSKMEHRRSNLNDDRSFKRRSKPITERPHKYEEAKYRREDSTHPRRYEMESSSYYAKNRARDTAENVQYSNSFSRNRDRIEPLITLRYDVHGSKRGDSDNYGRSHRNYYRRDSGSPKLTRNETERFSRSRRSDQPRYHDDEYYSKKTQSRDRSYNYSGNNDFTNNDFRSSNNSNRSSVKRSSDSLHIESVLTEDVVSKKRKAIDVKEETDVSRKPELSAVKADSPHISSQSTMLAATGNQSEKQSSFQHISKVEERKESPSSNHLSMNKILSSCDALSSDDDSEKFVAIDSNGDSDIERENKNVVTRSLDQKEIKSDAISNDKLGNNTKSVVSEKVKHENLRISESNTKDEASAKSEATSQDESTKKSSGLPFKICRSRFSGSSKDKGDILDKNKKGMSNQSRAVKQQPKKSLKHKEEALGSTPGGIGLQSMAVVSKKEKIYVTANEVNVAASNSSPYHIDDSEADEREKLLQTLFCNTKFYVVKSDSYANVALSKKEGVWSTQLQNEGDFNMAYHSGRNVILIFSVNESKSWQGFALITSGAFDNCNIPWTLPSKLDPKGLNGVFKLQWLNRSELPFSSCRLRNSYNDNKPVNVSRDGQEIEPDVAKKLCNMFKHDPGISISTLYSLVKACSNRRRRKIDQSRLDSDAKMQTKPSRIRKRSAEIEERSYTTRKRKTDYGVREYRDRKAYQGANFKSTTYSSEGRNYKDFNAHRGRSYAHNYKR